MCIELRYRFVQLMTFDIALGDGRFTPPIAFLGSLDPYAGAIPVQENTGGSPLSILQTADVIVPAVIRSV